MHVEKYFKDENRPWLVFLHGFGGSTKMWKRQIDQFKENYNLFVIDLPGHGKSLADVKRKCRELMDSKLEILQRCGHVCNIQKWHEFNHVALSYIDSIYSGKEQPAAAV